MRILGKATRSLPLALIAASLMMGTGSARAEREGSLFDALFGGIRYKPRNVDPRKVFPDAPRPRKAVAAPKVTGPSYYNYKADPLVRVDFAALRAAAGKDHVRTVARRAVDQRCRGRPGRLRPVCREGCRKGDLRLLCGQSAIHLGNGPERQREGAGGDSPARLGRQLRADRRPTILSPFRPRPPMAAMARPAWPNWCASR